MTTTDDEGEARARAREEAAAGSKRTSARAGRRGWFAVAAVLAVVAAVSVALVDFSSQDTLEGPTQLARPAE